MYKKLQKYKGLNNNLSIDIDNLGLNLTLSKTNCYVNFCVKDSNNRQEEISIPIDNFIDIVKSFNLMDKLKDEKFIVAKDRNNYLTNKKMNNYSKCIKDFQLQEKFTKNTSKYVIGGIYGGKTRQFLYLGKLFYYLDNIVFSRLFELNEICKYIIEPKQYHVLLEITLIYKDIIGNFTKLSEVLEYIFDNTQLSKINHNGHLILNELNLILNELENKLPVRSNLFNLKPDVNNSLDLTDKFYNKFNSYIVQNIITENYINTEFICLDYLFVSFLSDKKDIIMDNTNKLIKLINNYQKNYVKIPNRKIVYYMLQNKTMSLKLE